MSDRTPAIGDFDHTHQVRPDVCDAGSAVWQNADGDREEVPKLKFRCQGCGIGCESVALPWSKRISKFECRKCGYVSEIITRESTMDAIEGAIEEGAHEEAMKLRKSVSFNAAEFAGKTPQIVKGRLVYT